VKRKLALSKSYKK